MRDTDSRISCFFFFASRRRHTRLQGDWSSDVCSPDLPPRARSRCRGRSPGSCAPRQPRSWPSPRRECGGRALETPIIQAFGKRLAQRERSELGVLALGVEQRLGFLSRQHLLHLPEGSWLPCLREL